MPNNVMDQVHRIARQQKANLGMIFKDWNNIQLALDHDMPEEDSDDDDSNYDYDK